jgi:uncharacterized LabA/DUF88 family protein
LFGVDLVQLAAKGQIEDAVLIAGDSDRMPAIVAAKAEGVAVHLRHGATPHADLVTAATRARVLIHPHRGNPAAIVERLSQQRIDGWHRGCGR